MAVQRQKDREDADELRQLIADVQQAKREGTWTGPPSLAELLREQQLEDEEEEAKEGEEGEDAGVRASEGSEAAEGGNLL